MTRRPTPFDLPMLFVGLYATFWWSVFMPTREVTRDKLGGLGR